MATKENQPTPQDEEIDLGKLFQLIGRGFTKFYNFIASIFKALFHFLILILLFFRKHAIVLALSVIIGGVIGHFAENGNKKYSSSMTVNPNFNSTRQLYKNINYFDDLVNVEDTIQLARIFNIKTSEAASLKSFEIEPLITNMHKLSAYDYFVKNTDTLTLKNVDFKSFIDKLTPFDYRNQVITVEAVESTVFSKLTQGILNSLSTNNYLVRLKNTKKENLNTEENLAKINLQQVDSLRKVYAKVMIKEAEKPFSGTNIDMATGKEKTNKELELFNIQNSIKDQFTKINDEKTASKNIINVISNFSKVGTKESIIHRKPGEYAFGLFVLTLVVLLGLELNKFLKKYEVK